MPNWVRNVVKVSEDTMNKIKEKYFTDGKLDFNKVIPMPKTLDLTDGSITEYAIYYAFLQKDREKQREIIDILSKKEEYMYENYWDKIRNYRDRGDFKDIEQYAKGFIPNDEARKLNIFSLEKLGDTYINNVKEYGSPTWYDWCCDNWGTKWGACRFSCDKTTMIFDTAWATPEPIFERISKEFPDNLIELKYADECYGNENNGILLFNNGLESEKIKTSRKFYNSVWCESIENEIDKDIADEMFD